MAKSKDLNELFNYSLQGYTYVPSTKISALISNHDILDKEDWFKKKFTPFKKEYKEFYVSRQKFRCAICRFKIQADGDYEDIDHVISRSDRKKWMFSFNNLVCTCHPCNRRKNADSTLNNSYKRRRNFPDTFDAFLIFNPHYDEWSNHLKIEDDIFIVAKPGSKGYETIQAYKLYRYQVSINLALEQDDPNFSDNAVKVFNKLYLTIIGSKEEKELKKLRKRFLDLIKLP
jgi:5-methylcytosine-specific restriction endonuclease McrA